jgi:coenzyme F420-dependent glucose-6-phosphate dehydrogenase
VQPAGSSPAGEASLIQVGYQLSSEEHPAADLVGYARRAEDTGFDYAVVSDHFHPWLRRQGQSPFVWTVLGGVAQATKRLHLGTAVTAPIIRLHPAIVAQAAATAATLLPGRFFLGVGTGENLNEHVTGAPWPTTDRRQEMLEEAVEVIRALWEGRTVTHEGRHYAVDNARLFSRPSAPPSILVAASSASSAELAGRIGDGLIAVAPDEELVRSFEATGGAGKPRYGQVDVCWPEDEADARRTAHRQWPIPAFPARLPAKLRVPADFEALAELVTEEQVTEAVVCGPDPERHLARIRMFAEAGFDHVHVHQVGDEQEGFFRFYEREMRPRIREL